MYFQNRFKWKLYFDMEMSASAEIRFKTFQIMDICSK